jgi:hypothetical protein
MDWIPLAIGYFLGSIPFGLLLTRMIGIDIRQVGSGNIGTTNVLRTGNRGWPQPLCCWTLAKGWRRWPSGGGWVAKWAGSWPAQRLLWATVFRSG